MKSIVVQKFANRELRIGFQDLPPSRRAEGDRSEQRKAERYSRSCALVETEVVRGDGSIAYLLDSVNGDSIITQSEADKHEQMQSRALDIIRDFQRPKKDKNDTNRPGWGNPPKITRFGAYARHTILEAGAVASRGAGLDRRGVEVTLTLPSSSYCAYRAICDWSGYLVNRVLQAIRRHKQDIDWFYVWEVQKRGALHLHMALSGDCQSELLRLGRKVRKTWYRALVEVGRKSGANMFLRGGGRGNNTYREFLKGNRVAEIRKSLAAYFAKYVSKESGRKTGKGVVQKYYPSRWWGISRKLLSRVKKERLSVRFTRLSEEECIDLLSIAEGFVRRHSPIRSCSYSFELSYGKEGRTVVVGAGFRLIYWFDDSSFSSIQVWLPQLLRFLSKYCSNAVIEGDTAWALHTPVDVWSMQKLPGRLGL